MIFQWKPNTRVPVDPQIAGERLETLRERRGGMLEAADVVEDARPEDSPLHPAFEWDDGAAAEKYRQEQAKYLIRHIVVVVESEPAAEVPPRMVRAFVSVETDRSETRYTAVGVAMEDPDLRAQVVQRALAEAKQWSRRYRDLAELAKVHEVIDQLEFGDLP